MQLDYPALERQIAEKNKQKQIDAEKERRYLAEEERRMELIKCKENQLEEVRSDCQCGNIHRCSTEHKILKPYYFLQFVNLGFLFP